MTKNLPASVRARLMNVSKDQRVAFQEILVRYGIERLLYRLEQSPHASDFILKGATLFLGWTQQSHRPTKDVDFLAIGSPDIERLINVFSDVCQISVAPDGLEFDADSVEGSEIRENASYMGIRIKLKARLGGANIPLQIDIGFGDAVVPKPTQIRIPPLLDFPAPNLQGYTRYTVVAEKFDAMLSLGELNSRLKDYFDIWTLSRVFEFDGKVLRESIEATCQRRSTAIPSALPPALTPAFAAQAGQRAQWNRFINKIRAASPAVELDEVIECVAAFLWPPTQAIVDGVGFEKRWEPGGPWK